MAVARSLALSTLVIAAASCSRTASMPATSASPAPANRAPAGNAPQTVAPRRIPPSRDSLTKLRAAYVQQVMTSIVGRENQPAEQVFKNVQVLKGITAAQLVQKMDKEYSVGLSWNCTNCHRLAPQGNFASDTSNDKRRARFMQQMTNEINTAQLPKLYPKDTPQVTCATCHRGYNEPPSAEYLLPERGKLGGVPFPPPRGTPPAAGKPGS